MLNDDVSTPATEDGESGQSDATFSPSEIPEVSPETPVDEPLPEPSEESDVALSKESGEVPEVVEVGQASQEQVLGQDVNYTVRQDHPWPRGAVRAGIEGASPVGYGNTMDTALEDLKRAVGDA